MGGGGWQLLVVEVDVGGGGHGTGGLFSTELKLKFTKSCTLFMKPVKRSLNVGDAVFGLLAVWPVENPVVSDGCCCCCC